MDHDVSTIDIDGSQYDGVIDTWVVNRDFSGVDNIVVGSDGKDYFLSLFPDSINVLGFKMFVYPQKDRNLAWKETGDINVASYVRIQMSLLPSWKTLKKIPVIPSPITFSTTIALSDVWSK